MAQGSMATGWKLQELRPQPSGFFISNACTDAYDNLSLLMHGVHTSWDGVCFCPRLLCFCQKHSVLGRLCAHMLSAPRVLLSLGVTSAIYHHVRALLLQQQREMMPGWLYVRACQWAPNPRSVKGSDRGNAAIMTCRFKHQSLVTRTAYH